MPDCQDLEMRDLLPEFAADRLSGPASEQVAAHVATCDECAAEVELLRVARQALHEEAPAVDVERIVSALPDPPGAAVRPWIVSGPVVKKLVMREAVIVPRRSGRRSRPARRPMWTGWRLAAAVSTIAVGGLSLAVVQGIRSRESASFDQSAGRLVLPGTNVVAPVVGQPAAEAPSPPPSAVARSVTTPEAPPAVVMDNTVPLGEEGLAVPGTISELSDGEVLGLLQDLEGLDATPSDEPDAEAPGLHRAATP